MGISRKQIYWGVGIAAGLITIGMLVHAHNGGLKNVTGTAIQGSQKWIKPVAAGITSRFGYRTDPKTGKLHAFHNGVDFAVPVGTPIKNPRPAIVDAVTTAGDGGNQVILKHDNGFRTGYAHLSKVFVKKGDKVKQGAVIGLSGNTGKSTGPHLHFTLTNSSGTKVDPLDGAYSGIV